MNFIAQFLNILTALAN